MNDVSDRAADRFIVTYTEGEILTLSTLVARRADHDSTWFWSVLFAFLLGGGFRSLRWRSGCSRATRSAWCSAPPILRSSPAL